MQIYMINSIFPDKRETFMREIIIFIAILYGNHLKGE